MEAIFFQSFCPLKLLEIDSFQLIVFLIFALGKAYESLLLHTQVCIKEISNTPD